MLVDGRYEIIEQLGSGGMCTVYRAQHVTLHRQAAVKVLQDKLLKSQDAVMRFQREAVAVSALKHSNIVQTFGAGIWDNRPYLAMELLSGESLQELLKKEGRLDAKRALPIFKQICAGLEHAHEQGIVHRDMKPSNVMITADGGIKIVDFGIAKILPESGKEMQKLTQTGDLLGTLLYMSPEQLSGDPLDARSDLYSLGCMMYEVLEGKPPYTAEAPLAVINKHISHPVPVITNCDEKLGVIVSRLMAKRPEDRIQTASELGRLLDNPASVRAVAAPKSRRETRLKVPRPAVVGGSCAFLLVLALGILVLQRAQEEADRGHDLPDIERAMQEENWKLARDMAALNMRTLSARVNPRAFAETLKDMATCDFSMHNPSVALVEFGQLDNFAVANKDSHYEMPAASGVAACYLALENYAKAEPFADREYDLSKMMGLPDERLMGGLHVVRCKFRLGKDLSDPKKTQKGFETLRETFQLLKKHPDLEKNLLVPYVRDEATKWHYADWEKNQKPGPINAD